MEKLTEEQFGALRSKVAEWRARAEPVGPQHSLWDSIFDAEALLNGRPPMLSGTAGQVYACLMAIDNPGKYAGGQHESSE